MSSRCSVADRQEGEVYVICGKENVFGGFDSCLGSAIGLRPIGRGRDVVKLVLVSKCLEQVGGVLAPIVRDEGVRDSVTSKVLLGGLDYSGRLDGGQLIQFIEVAVMVHCDQID